MIQRISKHTQHKQQWTVLFALLCVSLLVLKGKRKKGREPRQEKDEETAHAPRRGKSERVERQGTGLEWDGTPIQFHCRNIVEDQYYTLQRKQRDLIMSSKSYWVEEDSAPSDCCLPMKHDEALWLSIVSRRESDTLVIRSINRNWVKRQETPTESRG